MNVKPQDLDVKYVLVSDFKIFKDRVLVMQPIDLSTCLWTTTSTPFHFVRKTCYSEPTGGSMESNIRIDKGFEGQMYMNLISIGNKLTTHRTTDDGRYWDIPVKFDFQLYDAQGVPKYLDFIDIQYEKLEDGLQPFLNTNGGYSWNPTPQSASRVIVLNYETAILLINRDLSAINYSFDIGTTSFNLHPKDDVCVVDPLSKIVEEPCKCEKGTHRDIAQLGTHNRIYVSQITLNMDHFGKQQTYESDTIVDMVYDPLSHVLIFLNDRLNLKILSLHTNYEYVVSDSTLAEISGVSHFVVYDDHLYFLSKGQLLYRNLKQNNIDVLLIKNATFKNLKLHRESFKGNCCDIEITNILARTSTDEVSCGCPPTMIRVDKTCICPKDDLHCKRWKSLT
ncbi:hypothetical protein RF11_13146 [Thelohanellus kitauei]|uniref:Uncharacterized protein n=1 Tax=Thelohanellus kitauei TaxID=669202 RepID=A0A0C2IZQ0_THEKT|nr:hypothetical protein RF11_13146 [Thelohanellus kitauei]